MADQFTLDSLNGFAPLSLDDLQYEPTAESKSINLPSVRNLAATASAFTDDPQGIVANYQASMAEYSSSGTSITADQLINKVQSQTHTQALSSLPSVLLDNTLTDDQKRNALNSVVDKTNAMYSPANILATKALTSAVKDESVEAEHVRLNTASVIQSVNASKEAQQAILNAEIAKSDPTTLETIQGIASMLLPFGEQSRASGVSGELKDNRLSSTALSVALAGESKQSLITKLNSLPPAQQIEFTQKLVDAVNGHGGIVASTPDNFSKVRMLQEYLDGDYSNADRFIDNVSSVLDMVGIGSMLKGGVTLLRGGKASAEVASGIERNAAKSRVQPTTVSQVYKDTNPDLAKGAHELTASDESGEAAQALYGTSREDAIAHDLMPEVASPDGSVANKVSSPDAINNGRITPSPELKDWLESDGGIYYTQGEKARMRAQLVNDFETVNGLNARKEMFSWDHDGTTSVVKAVYGPPQGGFASAQDAVDTAKFLLRDYGIDESNITLLGRQGDSYVPVSIDDLEQSVFSLDTTKGIPADGASFSLERSAGDYLIQVDSKIDINAFREPGELESIDQQGTLGTFFGSFLDRFSVTQSKGGAGSLSQNLLDAASVIDPIVVKSSTVATDKTSGLKSLLKRKEEEFTKLYKDLPSERKGAMAKMFREVNEQGINPDRTYLHGNGFSEKEIQAANKFREFWDDVYYLENRDLAKSLNAQGYMEYVSGTADSRYFAKPIAKPSEGIKAHDPSAIDEFLGDKVSYLDANALNEIYDNGGTIARLRSPVDLSDIPGLPDVAEYIVVKGGADGVPSQYLRAVTENTQVLNYRPGYYSVHYKDPYFIVEKVKGYDGKVMYERAVGTAKNAQDAKLFVERNTANSSEGNEFYYRTDSKHGEVGSDDHWNLSVAHGRSAQKTRGKRLVDVSSNATSPDMTNVLSPIDAMIASASSIARRTSMRDFLETTKARAVNQYGEYFPKNEFGEARWPNNVSEIGKSVDSTTDGRKLADARSVYNYVRASEVGYINSIDNGIKSGLRTIAETVGGSNFAKYSVGKKAEDLTFSLSDKGGPISTVKSAAYWAYLGTNPLRQAIIQGHQAVQLGARFTTQLGDIARQSLGLTWLGQNGGQVTPAIAKFMGMEKAEIKAMRKAYLSGSHKAAIERHNLIDGALFDLADKSGPWAKTKSMAFKYAGNPLNKVGFEFGERVNTLTSWVGHYNEARLKGRNMASSEVLDDVASAARNFTYNMTPAGEMAYNRNAASFLMQFMAAPHKALMTMTTNRQLTNAQKARLATFNLAMYGTAGFAFLPGVTSLTEMVRDQVGSDDVANLVSRGAESYLLNSAINWMVESEGDEVNLDFNALAPVGLNGIHDLFHNLMTDSAMDALFKTPAMSLAPRIQDVFHEVNNLFNTPANNFSSPQEWSVAMGDVAKLGVAVGSLSSGLSNAWKAAQVIQYGKKYGTLGGELDSTITTPMAIAQAFGFRDYAEAASYDVSREAYEASAQFEEDVKAHIKVVKRSLAREGATADEWAYERKFLSECWRPFNDSAKAKEICDQVLKRDLGNKDISFYSTIMDRVGILPYDKWVELVNRYPWKDENYKQALLNNVELINSAKASDVEAP